MKNKTKINNRLFCIAHTLLLIIFCPPIGLFAQSYEQPGRYQASQIVPAKLLTGKLHTVQPEVTSDGYMYLFTVNSEVGDFTARGIPYLEKLVAEVYMIKLLQEKYPTSDVAIDAAKDTATGLVTGPVKGAQKAYDTVTDSEKLKKTAKKIPGGVVNLFGAVAGAVGSGVEATYNAASSAFTKSEEGSSSEGNFFGDTASYIEDKALDFVGYNSKYREIAHYLKADPYTTNSALRYEMKRVAGFDSGLRFAGKFAPGLYGIPYVGTVNKFSGYADRLALYDDPKEIEKLSAKILDALQSVDNFGGTDNSKDAFMKNSAYSPIQRRMIVDALDQMKTVNDFGVLLDAANIAKTREIARFFTFSINELKNIHTQQTKLVDILEQVILPAGIDAKGKLYIVLSVDHILWTKDVEEIFTTTINKIKPKHGVKTIEIRVAGTMSERCRKELTKLGVTTIKMKTGY